MGMVDGAVAANAVTAGLRQHQEHTKNIELRVLWSDSRGLPTTCLMPGPAAFVTDKEHVHNEMHWSHTYSSHRALVCQLLKQLLCSNPKAATAVRQMLCAMLDLHWLQSREC